MITSDYINFSDISILGPALFRVGIFILKHSILPMKWTKPEDALPPRQKSKLDYLRSWSIRVIVVWQWDNPIKNPKGKKEELRWARYSYPGERWQIDGISGNTTVLYWKKILRPKVK
jgi:hypothetical protein